MSLFTFPVLQKLRTSVRAFTLIETLVSVMIITTVILGPLTVAMNASSYARQTKDTMIATYLAQEALELLRHQQDSIYLRCIGQANSTCTVQAGETQSNAAWRIFRTRLGSNTQGIASCYSNEVPGSCAYDVVDMLTNQDGDFPKYNPSSNLCSTLSRSPLNLYVCSGTLGLGAGYVNSYFTRTVSVTSVPTFSGLDQNYNDDLRVTITISFRRTNGFIRQIKVVDFLHARA